jgi:hypothetical protein
MKKLLDDHGLKLLYKLGSFNVSGYIFIHDMR